MNLLLHHEKALNRATHHFYCHSLDLLAEAQIPFLVGGAYALARYTGIIRHTKDFDLFIRREDCQRILDLFTQQGYRTEVTFPHWLGKIYHDRDVIDLIYSSGNGLIEVDDGWFSHAVRDSVHGRPVLLCPVEETIWSKAFVMERERYDGADIMHLLRACGKKLDWQRLVERFGAHWRLLLSHLILFTYVYPQDMAAIPDAVVGKLLDKARAEQMPSSDDLLCQGTLLSRSQYLIDIHEWIMRDARLPPHGRMSPEAIAHWTAAIGIDNPSLEKDMPDDIL